MKAGNLKRRIIFILLVFAFVFSTVSVTPLAHSGELVYDPGGMTIVVVQGENFLIRHVLEWDEVENGAYTITVGWYNYGNKAEENLTFVSASAYFTTGSYVGESIRADVTLTSVPSGSDTAWSLVVECPATNKDPRNGEFNVDIWMGAYGAGGVPHIPGDHEIPWMLGGVIVVEKYPQSWNRDPITIRVLSRSISVSISPSSQSAQPGATFTYSFTVTNKGDFADNYNLTVSDDVGWGATLAQNLLTIPAGESRTTAVSVTVPSDAAEDELTGITVTARSQANPNVSDYDTCTAIAKGVPPSGLPIPIPVLGGAAIGVGAVAAIVLLLKRGMLHLAFCAVFGLQQPHNLYKAHFRDNL